MRNVLTALALFSLSTTLGCAVESSPAEAETGMTDEAELRSAPVTTVTRYAGDVQVSGTRYTIELDVTAPDGYSATTRTLARSIESRRTEMLTSPGAVPTIASAASVHRSPLYSTSFARRSAARSAPA